MDREQFALRAQALAVDVLIAVVAMLTVGFVVGVHWGQSVAVMGAIITGAMYTTIEMFSGASPGKMCVNLKIVGVYSYQARLGTLMARWAVKNLPWLLKLGGVMSGSAMMGWTGLAVGVVLVGGFFLALRPEGQTLLDRVAGTVVGSGQPRVLKFEEEVHESFFKQAA